MTSQDVDDRFRQHFEKLGGEACWLRDVVRWEGKPIVLFETNDRHLALTVEFLATVWRLKRRPP